MLEGYICVELTKFSFNQEITVKNAKKCNIEISLKIL